MPLKYDPPSRVVVERDAALGLGFSAHTVGFAEGVPSMGGSTVDEVEPKAAWEALANGEGAILIDVRTRPEWSFVGLPQLPPSASSIALIEWQEYPAMQINARFVEDALAAISEAGAKEVYFLCRSGVRSLHAARAVAAAADSMRRDLRCVNVAGGFEGDASPEGQRGRVNGWKAQGLPWRQS